MRTSNRRSTGAMWAPWTLTTTPTWTCVRFRRSSTCTTRAGPCAHARASIRRPNSSSANQAAPAWPSIPSSPPASSSPALRFQVFDTSAAYLWALARDSKGNLYAGGGTGAKLFRIPPGGPGKLLAELDALEIHAIAVDARDRVYVATAPDGKVYRITGNAKPEVFYDPKAKYIWALAFDHKGDLLVATGDHGEIHRVTPDGKGKVFFQSDETHVRSMAVDAADNLIVGTDPGGLVLRVTPAGEGFVLYQMAKKEVTAVAVERDGAIYAAAAGNKQPALPSSPMPVAVPPAPAGGLTVTVNQPDRRGS